MPWQDRVKVAAYISPSGTRLTFDFENVSSEFDKLGEAFNFPDAERTYMQD